jgi:GWxTD domain-containing protein
MLLLWLILFSAVASFAEDSPGYYRRWLEEDVFWIISEEERDVLLKLKTDEERDHFIEQFWARRDPDPATLENEFKVEHYRRIVYANDHYSAGIAGWKTDRGMIYIKHGPPDRLESHPGGGPYARDRQEGGGMTTVFPFERWEYKHIEGIGEDVELEFVDDKGGSLYELTWDKQRKDALLYSGRMGLTQDEIEQLALTGKVDKRDRILGRRESGDLTGIYAAAGAFESAKDKPMAQLSTSMGLSRPPVIRFKDLEAIVTARVAYHRFLFSAHPDFIRITDQQVLTPITILLSNEQMTFRQEGGLYQAVLQVFGRVVGVGNRIAAVFEEEVVRELSENELEKSRKSSSLYQKRLILRPGLYKLELVVKDAESKRIGTLEQRLEVPRFDSGQLQFSSLVLAERIEPGSRDLAGSSFLLGDLKVVPKMTEGFSVNQELGLYAQIYNFSLDAQTSRPALRLEYSIAPLGREPEVWRDATPQIQYASQYGRLARMISLRRLSAGAHTLRLRATDRITGQTVEARAAFTLLP